MGRRARAHVVLVALLSCGTVAAAAFGLQAVGLPHPSRALVVAAGAVRELDRFRFARSTETIDGAHVDGTCFEGWFRRPRQHRPMRGDAVVFRGGGQEIAVGPLVWRIGRIPVQARRASYALRLACPEILGDVLARALVRGHAVVREARGDGRPVYALRFRFHRQRLALLVDRATLKPLVITIASPGVVGSSDVETGVAPATARHVLHLLRTGRRTHASPA